ASALAVGFNQRTKLMQGKPFALANVVHGLPTGLFKAKTRSAAVDGNVFAYQFRFHIYLFNFFYRGRFPKIPFL
ncbi:MAG: hypothetical protein VX535_05030, partial [Pseudomonadota bacterium]|nr:hypothetical protein [Pseudomonadota bacterium]